MSAFFRAHDRIEPLGVKVAVVDVVTGITQGGHHGAVEGGIEAVIQRVGENHHDAHYKMAGRIRPEAPCRPVMGTDGFVGPTKIHRFWGNGLHAEHLVLNDTFGFPSGGRTAG